MLEKKPLVKKTEVLDFADDLGMLDFEGHQVEIWSDPSRQVVADLLGVILVSAEALKILDEKEAQKVNDKFFSAVSEFLIDSTIEGLDFSTKESCEAAFENRSIPWGGLYECVSMAVIRLIQENERISKALALFSDKPVSGEDKRAKGSKSNKESSTES